MLDIYERLKSLNCKTFASHVRSFDGGWYEKHFPLTPGDIASYGPLEQVIMQKAAESIQNAEADITYFQVGACILSYDGQLYMGHNKETAANHGLCAEEIAWAQLPKGEGGKILAVAVAMKAEDKQLPPMPCGECRQKIFEHSAGNIPIIGVKVNQKNKIWEIDFTNIGYLLPQAFRLTQKDSQ